MFTNNFISLFDQFILTGLKDPVNCLLNGRLTHFHSHPRRLLELFLTDFSLPLRLQKGQRMLKLIQIHDPVLQHITSKEIPTETQRLRQCACDIVDHQSFSNYLTFIFYLSFSEDFQLSQLAGSPKDFKIISCFSV